MVGDFNFRIYIGSELTFQMRKEAALGTEELAVIESKALSIATEAHAGQVDKGGCENICPFLEVLWYNGHRAPVIS